jgi:predicted phosphohydrolase
MKGSWRHEEAPDEVKSCGRKVVMEGTKSKEKRIMTQARTERYPTVQYASDLHLEFPENKAFLRNNPLIPSADILLLAGDVVPFASMEKNADFFRFASDHFEETYWVPGNHEYYGSDVSEKGTGFQQDILPNVHLIQNVTVQKEGLRLIFSTLWGHVPPDQGWYIERNMSDFHWIRDGKYSFSSESFNRLHAHSLSFISSALRTPAEGQTIVVTHHVPTFSHYPPEYRESRLNPVFAVELFDLIEGSKADFWIYGHHHRNIPEFLIGATHMLTNQVGYVAHGEQRTFDPAKTIVLS